MKKVNMQLEYCHGISKMDYIFDFSDKNYIIYAMNGTMKTSLYKTINDFKSNENTIDAYFPERITKRELKDENGIEIGKDSILTAGSEEYEADTNKITSLLVNNDLKKRYDKITTDINKLRETLEKKIKSKSGETIDKLLIDLKIKNIEDISKEFLNTDDVLNFDGIKYSKVFSEENVNTLKQKIISDSIKDYVSVSNKIIKENKIFVKDIFELHNLKSIKKILESNNYFSVGHLLKLKNIDNQEYADYDEDSINDLISSVDSLISKDSRIAAVNIALTNKIKSLELKELISKNQWMIPYFNDIDSFKVSFWKYLINIDKEINNLIIEYQEIFNSSKNEIETIVKESISEKNYKKWNEAVDIFNTKFINMPFKLRVDNISDIILKNDVCSLKYEFSDGNNTNYNVDITTLKENLSKGEKRAFTILNLIFEIQYRKEKNIETLLIIDDIADSFDYKNKYAIIEFLNELNKDPLFHIIILTHNFDFYRTCSSRLDLNQLTVIKDSSINLIDFHYNRNVFTTFKQQINQDKYYIASIPYTRNIIELESGTSDCDYIKLTSLVHYKPDTSSIVTDDISKIYLNRINISCKIINQPYLKLLFSTADNFVYGNNKVELENKLVLSIAIRMKLEMILFNRINNWTIINSWIKNQTYEMINYCRQNNLLNNDELKICDKVSIMTSDNIHVNAFMYEPIIDMGDDELINLYNEVKLMK